MNAALLGETPINTAPIDEKPLDETPLDGTPLGSEPATTATTIATWTSQNDGSQLRISLWEETTKSGPTEVMGISCPTISHRSKKAQLRSQLMLHPWQSPSSPQPIESTTVPLRGAVPILS